MIFIRNLVPPFYRNKFIFWRVTMEYQYPLDLDWSNDEMVEVIKFLIKSKTIMKSL